MNLFTGVKVLGDAVLGVPCGGLFTGQRFPQSVTGRQCNDRQCSDDVSALQRIEAGPRFPGQSASGLSESLAAVVVAGETVSSVCGYGYQEAGGYDVVIAERLNRIRNQIAKDFDILKYRPLGWK